jgi:NADH:ubiquinone oxidoreductase subunit 3 (subunit A)
MEIGFGWGDEAHIHLAKLGQKLVRLLSKIT